MYNHKFIEEKVKKFWLENNTFSINVKDNIKKKYYALDMFPYPSGQGLHVGHPKGYTATDIIARYKRFNGFNVMHPIGWDAFGLPAEQYAIQTNNHPEEFTNKNIQNFRKQLQDLGFSFDYKKEINTTDPKYYKWTQWIFSQLFKHDLAEIKDIEVNWCEELKTVLANEEVLIENGKMVSERGHYPVIKKPMRQWVLKITKYADKLLDGLKELDWPESLKTIQETWIGRSEGIDIKFNFKDIDLEVFTTRADTLYGVSFIAIAPENKYVSRLTTSDHLNEVEDYIKIAKEKTNLQRVESKIKTGVFTGGFAINPINKKFIPIFVADYVLNDYANGLVMGVPGCDARDHDFAKKHNLEIIKIIDGENEFNDGDGKHINSEMANGLDNKQANEVIVNWLIKNNFATKKINYKLKDWIFSRQRYWGEPFPIIFDSNNKPHLVENLPVLLPKTNKIQPSQDGTSPLSNLKDWVNITIDDKQFKRETNTMPQWAGSCWYYLAYLLRTNDGYIDLDSKEAFEIFKNWLPVDLYVGGQEHAVLHLLYARFWHRFLYDIKIVPTKEPFFKIVNQGMILGPNGEKMSKSKGNVINPDEIVNDYGADTLRIYEMFMGPITSTLPWNDDSLSGSRKWLDRVYNWYTNNEIKITDDIKLISEQLNVAYHEFIYDVSGLIDNYQFNVAISKMMVYINECVKNKIIYRKHHINFLIVLSCFAPFLAQHLYELITKSNNSITIESWPEYDKNMLIKDKITLPIQINGKVRDVFEVFTSLQDKDVIELAKRQEKIKNYLSNQEIKKVVYVKGKILNFII